MNITNNNINFKGFYATENSYFSEKQNKVIDDIKSKLGNRINDGDYIVSPGAIIDSIDLQHFIFGLKTTGAGLDKKYMYEKGTDKFIGSYNEEHPFNLEDLDVEPWKNSIRKSDNTWKFIAATIIALGAILIGNGAIKKYVKNQNNNIIENIAPTVKDSLNTVKKDSLNLFM
ncbi:hypothetical protein IJ384_00040 [bacterium]|nr:hypothetical protein [bacterium]